MNGFLECVQTARNFTRRRRNISCVGDRLAFPADIILASSEFTGPSIASANPFHQFAVQLANEAQRNGKLLELLQPIFKGGYVVPNLADIGFVRSRVAIEFKQNQLLLVCIRAFDSAGKFSFAPDKWSH